MKSDENTVNPPEVVRDIMALISRAPVGLRWGNSPVIKEIEYSGFLGHQPGHSVFRLLWDDFGQCRIEHITEKDLLHARVVEHRVYFPREDGEQVVDVVTTAAPEPRAAARPVFLLDKPALPEDELHRMSLDGNSLDVVVSVPWSLPSRYYVGRDEETAYRDYLAERVTGHIDGVAQLRYGVHHLTEVERRMYGAPNANTVLLRMVGFWNPPCPSE